jgi:hypothetical protein
MIDTYFDRADASLGYRRTPYRPVWNDPRFFMGQLYSTMIERNAAEARFNLKQAIDQACWIHRSAIYASFRNIPRP